MAFFDGCVVMVLLSGIASEAASTWGELAGPVALVRLKRAPQRSFTFSGFNPSNGLTALATSAELFPPYYNYQSAAPQYNNYALRGSASELQPPSVSNSASPGYTPDYKPQSEYPSSDTNTEDRSISQNLTPPSENAPTTSYNENKFQTSKNYKKKPYNMVDEDDEDDDGMYPSHASSNSAYKDEDAGTGSNGGAPSKDRWRGLGTTVIANSISHGKSSVASSHAIAYGGDPSEKSYSKG